MWVWSETGVQGAGRDCSREAGRGASEARGRNESGGVWLPGWSYVAFLECTPHHLPSHLKCLRSPYARDCAHAALYTPPLPVPTQAGLGGVAAPGATGRAAVPAATPAHQPGRKRRPWRRHEPAEADASAWRPGLCPHACFAGPACCGCGCGRRAGAPTGRPCGLPRRPAAATPFAHRLVQGASSCKAPAAAHDPASPACHARYLPSPVQGACLCVAATSHPVSHPPCT